RYPAKASDKVAQALERDPQARVFADVRYADWLLWRVPQVRGRVAFDVRFELLSHNQLERLYRWTTESTDRWRSAATGASVVAIGSLVFALTALSSRYLFPDTYMNLASGRYIAQHGIPHREIWTVAGQGREWVDQQWLAHLVYYGAWRVGGFPLLALLSTSC